MQTIKFDLSKKAGKFKPMHAVNNGPIDSSRRTNLYLFNQARPPYGRVHDAAIYTGYGGCHVGDVSAVFPDFTKNPYDPYSYDFPQTDKYIANMVKAGMKPYFKLGQTIDHFVRKYGSVPPADFKKWAVVCEHIILHYTRGWANGFNYDIEYWEIWNEPDLENECAWTGTDDQFFDLYETVAKHLKRRFPNLKIGGPAIVSSVESWYTRFLSEMRERNVPIDFFSWHRYPNVPEKLIARSEEVRKNLIKYGYGDTESHVTEWNYMAGIWDEHEISSERELSYNYAKDFRFSFRGASHALSIMSAAQNSDIKVLCYYDTRPATVFNGWFDFETLLPYKTFYPFTWFARLYEEGVYEVKAENKLDNVYTLCGVKEDGKLLATLTFFDDDQKRFDEVKDIKLDFGKKATYNVYAINEQYENELIATTDDLSFTVKMHDCYLIEEI